MRVALVYDAVYPDVKGGVEKRVFVMARELAKRHEVHVFGMHSWKGVLQRKMGNVLYYGVMKPRQLYSKGKRSLLQPFVFSFFLLLHLLKEDIDLIDCQNFPYLPAFVCKIYTIVRRKKLVMTWSEFWGDYWFEYLGFLGVFGRWIEYCSLYLSKKNISVSRFTQQRLPVSSVVIENSVDRAALQRIRPAKMSYDLIFFGRLVKEKKVELILQALIDLPRVQCLIVGEGPEKEKLITQAQTLGVLNSVTFSLFLDEARLFSLVKSAKIAVFPSQREGFGMSVLEALACGCPVVAVRGTAVDSLVQDGVNGFLCDSDPQVIAAVIRKILRNEVVRRKLQRNALVFAARFDSRKLAAKLEKYYAEVV